MNLGFLLDIARLPELPSTHSAIGGDIQQKSESPGRSLGRSVGAQSISPDRTTFPAVEFQSKLE